MRQADQQQGTSDDAGAQGPVIIPRTPGGPGVPPLLPRMPGGPALPNDPFTPIEPSMPVIPVAPLNPVAPGVPRVPGFPDDPIEGLVPGMPGEPGPGFVPERRSRIFRVAGSPAPVGPFPEGIVGINDPVRAIETAPRSSRSSGSSGRSRKNSRLAGARRRSVRSRKPSSGSMILSRVIETAPRLLRSSEASGRSRNSRVAGPGAVHPVAGWHRDRWSPADIARRPWRRAASVHEDRRSCAASSRRHPRRPDHQAR